MSRPKNITVFMIGVARPTAAADTDLSRIAGKRRKLLEKDPWYADNERPDAFGIILTYSLKCPPANVAFGPEELEERIAIHSRRVELEQERLKEDAEKHHRKKKPGGQHKNIPDWVRVVNCCHCQKILLSEAQPGTSEVPREDITKERENEVRRLKKKFGIPACRAPFKGHLSHFCVRCATIAVPVREPNTKE